MVYTINMIPKIEDIFILMKDATETDKMLITKAYNFSQTAHEGQLRKSGEPYFIHVVETAKTLARIGMDTKTIVAGLLHDVLEDTQTPESTLKKEFGDEIVKLIHGVTKLGAMKYQGHERHVESLRKFFLAMANDMRVLIIKLADRLHNVRTLEHVRPDKQKRIALETIEIHARLADRIGMGKLKGELEDASFPFAYPKEYEEVKKRVDENLEINKKELTKVRKDLEEILKKENINVIEIDQRVKHLYSLWQKLNRYNMDISKIHDIVALRVIVENVEDCYRVLGLVHSLWTPMPGRIKDYIALPKPNGYRSLHTTIFTGNGAIVEIQIRTAEMHAEAAYGIAAHFIYKADNISKDKNSPEKKLEWVHQLKELQKAINDPKKLIEDLKMDLFHDRIFVFTPKGDVIDLPAESSAIDFAYAIHSDIGNHAKSAKINGKQVTLHTKLQNNDLVEIQTNKKTNPSSKWLEYAKTTMAKKHINAYLKENSLLSKFRSFAKF